MKKLIMSLLVGITLLPVPTKAYRYSGNDLVRDCEGADVSFCRGYMAAWINTLELVAVATHSPLPVCISEELTLEQGISVVVNYLRNHPEDGEKYTAESNMLVALNKAYPCRR